MTVNTLLAIDAGLTCGFAFFCLDTQRLLRYRSHHYGSLARLRRAAVAFLGDEPTVRAIVVEGGGDIATAWQKPAQHRRIPIVLVTAQQWRADALLPREQRRGTVAKKAAIVSARDHISAHADRRTKSLRDDTAEAIMVGEWALSRLSILFPAPLVTEAPLERNPDDPQP
ncbi:MAG: hypothetical protein RLZZ297_565 [Chloroflexota bacterium]|jgi:hypothetical protein